MNSFNVIEAEQFKYHNLTECEDDKKSIARRKLTEFFFQIQISS